MHAHLTFRRPIHFNSVIFLELFFCCRLFCVLYFGRANDDTGFSTYQVSLCFFTESFTSGKNFMDVLFVNESSYSAHPGRGWTTVLKVNRKHILHNRSSKKDTSVSCPLQESILWKLVS